MTITTRIRRTALAFAGITAAAALATGVGADPVDGDYYDVPECDNHGHRVSTEEFGWFPFFQRSQWIDPIWSEITLESACPGTDDPAIDNVLVTAQNITGRNLENLFYVGDNVGEMGQFSATTFSNQDGVATQFGQYGMAFRIDDQGVNRPLLFESMVGNSIWEPDEWWSFIIQDYVNTDGNPPEALWSVGYADGSNLGPGGSSGSIVQFVPPVQVCPGDIDGNGSRDVGDLLGLLGNWGGPGAGDLDGSGAVAVPDLLLLLSLWGPCSP